jgi:hypothetical protein
MKNRIIASFAVIVSLIAITVVTFSLLRHSAQGQKEQPVRVTKLPQVISQVDNLEILSASLRNEGTRDAIAVIEIKNNSNKPIIAVAIVSGDDKDYSGTSLEGFGEGDEPTRIIFKPNEIFKMEMPLANVLPGFPIRVSSVMYADGTEAGDEMTL